MKTTQPLIMKKTNFLRVYYLIAFLWGLSLSTLSATSLVDSTYCSAAGTSPWQEWIQNIKIKDSDQTITYLDHSSFKEGYGEFTDQVAVLQKNASDFFIIHRFEATAGYSWNSYLEYVVAWIDFK